MNTAVKRFFIALQRYWLLMLLFLIPISLKYVTKEPFAVSYLNFLSVGFIGIGLINLVSRNIPYKSVRYKPFVWLLVVFLIAMAYALPFTHPLRNGVGLWTSRLAQPLLVGFFAYQLFINDEITLNQCLQSLFWSLVPLLILGGLQQFGVIDYRDPGRITGPYFYPNTFARYVEILLLTTLPWIIFGLKKYRRLYMGIWLLGCILLLSSESYNGVTSFGVGLLTIFLLLPAEFRRLKRVVVTSLVALGLLIAVNASHLPKYQTSINDSRKTRLEFWHVAGNVLEDGHNFWTGIGIKTWEKEYPHFIEKYGPFPPLNWGSVQPHNVFLDALLKAGLPGLFAITAILFWPIAEGTAYIKSFKQKNPNWWFGLSMAGYGTAMLTFGLIDDPIWSDDTMPLLFILFFLLAGAIYTYKSKQQVLG